MSEILERVLELGNDLSKLDAEEKAAYYIATCNSLSLNPLTRPLEYITLNGKLQLYAKKDATEQLRRLHKVSINKLDREILDGLATVVAYATNYEGRTDSSIGAVNIGNLTGENRANALMKAETKAKRRVTLSICGLGILDESELESINESGPYREVINTTHAATPPPAPVVAPPVDHTPAEGKVAPRPGEKKEDLPAYTPPLTLEDKLNFERQSQKALNAATAPAPFGVAESPADTPKEPAKKADKKVDKRPAKKKVTAAKEDVKTDEKPATEPAPVENVLDPNRLPNKAEWGEIMTKIKTIRDRVGGPGSKGSEDFKSYLLKVSGHENTKEITVAQWIAAFKKLEDAVDDNDLKEIITKTISN